MRRRREIKRGEEKEREREREGERPGNGGTERVEGAREEGGEKSFKNYRRAAISPAGRPEFFTKRFYRQRQLGPPGKKRIRARAAFFGPRCASREMAGSQLIRNERPRLTDVQRLFQL